MSIIATAYKYENEEVGNGILYEMRGLVSYQSKYSITCWHGSWQHDHAGRRMVVKFDCNGVPEKAKTVVLYATTFDEVYEGWDYQGRVIRLTQLRIFEFDFNNRCWR